MLEILLSPIDLSRSHDVGAAISWHGRFMVFAWGFLLPMGVFAARFCKVLIGQNWPLEIQNPFWFKWHRILQYSGLVLMVLALGIIQLVPQSMPGARLHHWFGWSVAVLAGIQFAAALFKGSGGGPDHDGRGRAGGDHFMMTPTRVVFEGVHKSLGYVSLLVSVGSIITGMWIANAYVWMWLAQLGLWASFIVAFVVLQKRGCTIDTYQAIWGTDPSFPGNQREPIGWGIRRGQPISHGKTANIKKGQAAEKGRAVKRH